MTTITPTKKSEIKLGWAKYTGYPIWPCRTALESEVGPDVLKKKER